MQDCPKAQIKAALYNEFGIIPISEEIKKKKMLMWKRLIDRRRINEAVGNMIKEQCMKGLPWFNQLIKIAQ